MALNIEGASIGFDANNVETALNNLNTHVIQDSITKMNGSLQTLRESVDNAWVGASAEQFKKNMESDVKKITQALQDTYEILKTQMYSIVNEMASVDQELVQGRSE